MNLSASELRTMVAMATASEYYMKIYPTVWSILSIGNLVSLIVFLQKDMRRVHSNVYLCFLAVADMVCTNTPAWSGIQQLIEGGLTAHNLKFWAKGKLWEYLIQSSVILSGWLLVVISVDRLVMVYFPLWSKSHLTPRKAFIFTSLTSLPFVLYPMHNLIGRDGTNFYPVDNTSLDTSIMFVERFISEQYEHFYLVTHLKYAMPTIHTLFFGPTFALNAAIIFKLFQHARRRSETLGHRARAGQGDSSVRITVMLVTVSVLGLMLRYPFVILHIVAIEPYIKREMDVWWLAFWYLTFEISYSLLYLNSCINFFVYVSFSNKFKAQLVRLFCRCCKRGKGREVRGRKQAQQYKASDTLATTGLSESAIGALETSPSETGLSNPC